MKFTDDNLIGIGHYARYYDISNNYSVSTNKPYVNFSMNAIVENETHTLLYPGRAQKPEDQAKYAAAMGSQSGTAKTIYALLDWCGGWSLMAALGLAICLYSTLTVCWPIAWLIYQRK